MDMKKIDLPDNPYLLLTPGPLSTTKTVKEVMLQDWCTWDDDYNNIVQSIRYQLVALATDKPGYTSVLMQGSGSFGIEATLTTVVPKSGKLLILTNGAYGDRMVEIAQRCQVEHFVLPAEQTNRSDLDQLANILDEDSEISHVAVVHCETTTGLLNPIESIGRIVKGFGKTYIVDAMSSFGGIPIDIGKLQIDYLVSSANKCIQGIPGFSFVIALEQKLKETRHQAKSLALDLFDQWETMEKHNGKWRFTSPTHTVRAFAQALKELEEEGGISVRFSRYQKNHQTLVNGMRSLGFRTLLADKLMSPIITSFYYPENPEFQFKTFYQKLKERGFVIYPGKISKGETFRIGTIGDVHPADIERLLDAVESSIYW